MTTLARMRLLVAAIVAASLAACSYDWDIGSPTSSGSDAGPGGQDAGDAADAGADADAGPSCATLLAALASARAAAKACPAIGGACPASITDECGCKSHVQNGSSAAATAFSAAVQQVVEAGCTTSCSTCLTTPGTCLLTPAQVCTP